MSDSTNHREARAEAKAARAPAQAMRPWYRKKRTWLGGFVVLIVVIIAVTSTGGGSGTTPSAGGSQVSGTSSSDTTAPAAGTSDTSDTSDTSKKNDAPAAHFGTPVKSGDFQHTVGDMKCGQTSLGGDDFGVKTQGQFRLVTIAVKYTDDSSHTFISSDVKLADAEGTQYSASDADAIYLPGQDTTFLEDINPGNTVKGTLVYDVPQEVTPTTASVQGSLLSGTEDIALH